MTAPQLDPAASIEEHDIAVDWAAFAHLSQGNKQKFVRWVQRLEDKGWFARNGRPQNVWACIDLARYSDYGEYVRQLKKEGAAFYEGRKAEKRGYYTKFFDSQTFIGDVVAINTSAPERQGRPMESHYMLTVEERGGYATEIRNPVPPAQGVYWVRHFGTFRAQPGHRQGELVVDEQLLSYLIVHRYGNFALYGVILGHSDHLKDGVVYKMHLDFVRTILDAKVDTGTGAAPERSFAGLRYLCYAEYFAVPRLRRWKKSNLFRPYLFRFDYTPALQYLKAT